MFRPVQPKDGVPAKFVVEVKAAAGASQLWHLPCELHNVDKTLAALDLDDPEDAEQLPLRSAIESFFIDASEHLDQTSGALSQGNLNRSCGMVEDFLTKVNGINIEVDKLPAFKRLAVAHARPSANNDASKPGLFGEISDDGSGAELDEDSIVDEGSVKASLPVGGLDRDNELGRSSIFALNWSEHEVPPKRLTGS